MISRTWNGIVPEEHEAEFQEYLNLTGVKEVKEIEGNLGVYMEKVLQDGYCHFFLCTIWASWKEIFLYAGKQPHIAISYPEDSQYGLISDPIVAHQEVSNANNPFVPQHI